ncbi:MAG: hypothetical protein NC931_01610, partial [Candidatus Omnitrophica bacterium]|nr:hypothetical protein [Candidatus Omnitrophota bacterium]
MPTKKEITTIIQNIGLWDRAAIEKALQEQEATDRPLKEVFQNMGLLPFGDIPATLFFQLGIVQQNLPLREIPSEVINLMSPSFAKKHRVIPWEIREDQKLVLVTDDPINIIASDYFKKVLDVPYDIEIIVTFPNEIDQLIAKYFEQQDIEDLSAMLQEVGSADTIETIDDEEVSTDEDEEALALQAPVVKIVNLIFVEALRRRASDIHLEPME